MEGHFLHLQVSPPCQAIPALPGHYTDHHLQELRKTLVASAPSKSFHLFYINFDQVFHFAQFTFSDTCHIFQFLVMLIIMLARKYVTLSI